MKIGGFQKLTLVDYPGKMACIIFALGCNYKCPYCHNSPLLKKSEPLILEEEIFDYIKKRKNVLDAIVVSGGEPTLQKDLISFLEKLKQFGLKIKLDTNGSNPEVLEKIFSSNLVDYVAMDIKNSLDKYSEICGLKNINTEKVLKSIKLIKNNKNIDHEFRTTVVKELHTQEDIEKILKLIRGSKYYIQNFVDSKGVMYEGLSGFSEEELNELKIKFPDLIIRG